MRVASQFEAHSKIQVGTSHWAVDQLTPLFAAYTHTLTGQHIYSQLSMWLKYWLCQVPDCTHSKVQATVIAAESARQPQELTGNVANAVFAALTSAY